MYGLVHTAVRDLVTQKFGQSRWDNVLRRSGVGEGAFEPMQPYDDSIVLSLVSATSEELGLTPAECLEAFGQFWVLDTAQKHYPGMLKGYGDSIWDLLEHLDQMHDRMSATFQGYDAPSFELERGAGGTCRLHYRSSRQGLTPMVVGLLSGLAELFGTRVRVEVESETHPDEGGQHTVFLLTETAS